MKKEHRFPLLCLLIVLVAFIICAIKPLYPADWLMESYLVFISVPLLLITYKWFKFSKTSYLLITIFLVLHMIGSHYTYASVPFGFWLQNLFHFSRNHYDRIVHFLWGLMLYLPTLEIASRYLKIKSRTWLFYLVPVFILVSFGAIFEVIEWIVAATVHPELGLAYLGTQGDIWDTQKDLLVKFIGAMLAAPIVYFFKKE